MPRRTVPVPRAAAAVAIVLTACGAAGDAGSRGDPEYTGVASLRTPDGIEYTATTRLLASYPVRLRVTTTAMNRGSRSAVLRFADTCPLRVRALTRERQLRWDQARVKPCDGPGAEVRLASGESVDFDLELTAADVLGDSLPDMLYVLVAALEPLDRSPVVLQAGRAFLVTPREARPE
jgi:hypothetical protein